MYGANAISETQPWRPEHRTSKWRWTSSADTVSGRPVTKTLLLAASVAPSAEPWFAPPTATEEETEAAATTPNAMKGPPARTIRCSAAEWRAIPGQLTSRLNVSDACSRVAAVERPASRRQRLKPSQQTAPRPWGSPATAHAPDGATLDDEAQRLPLPSPSMRSRNEAPHVPATARPVEPGSGASVTPCRKASEAHNRPRRLHAIARGLHARRWSSAAKTAAEIAPKPGAHGTKTGYPRCLSSVDHRAMHE